ncbi:putative amp dependent CoA ligase [Plenodomus tracheiphilus IPT5]|uniref:Putative amp dependent CoA ligase n=1 Tax=Plenodomus tracheiphilus IPT5 TaxID=1408161 RepID=A0A6A7AQ10_9PLEO|nr:putative amp dependent CoA ligase [Plenodomus tracheiphilus IPT5]
MEYSLLGICALVLAFGYLSLWSRSEKKLRESYLLAEDDEGLAEIKGMTWPQLSVFEHIERGLRRNPHGAAVVCLMEQSASIQNLVMACSEHTHSPEIEGTLPSSPAYEEKITAFTLTYTQLHRIAFKLATGLLAVGVRPNTRMIMLIPNGAEYAILLWACILLRITYVNMDPAFLDISGFTALKQTLQTIKPQLVVAPDACSGKAIDVATSELGLPQPVRICLSKSALVSTGWKTLFAVTTHANSQNFPDDASLVSAARHDDSNRVNSIMFTSGTSGMPKGCPQTVAAISHALHSQEWLIDSDSGAARHALMQAHNSRGIAPAQTLQTWRAGGAVVLTGQGFSVHDAIKAIHQLGVSFLVLTPPMVHEFTVELAKISLDISSVKRIQIGGDAVTKEVLVKCAALFPQAQVCVNQGMTEGPGVFAWPFLETSPKDIRFFGGQICSVGIVAPGAKIRLRSTACGGAVVKRGELGELHISCPSIIKHYLGGYSEDMFYNDTKGRWFNTTDMAMVDSSGLVFIVGRRKDMIQRAGITIAPAVIESCIAALTQCQAVVVPVPHSVLGAEPMAVIDSFAKTSAEQIKQHVNTALGKDYALRGVVCLKQLGFVDFPVNATHKIIKSELQEAVLKYCNQTPIELVTVKGNVM